MKILVVQESQRTFNLSADIDIPVNGKERSIDGTMVFMPKSDGNSNGSISIKLKSGAISLDPDEKAEVLKTIAAAFEEAYDAYLDKAVAHRENQSPGQVSLLDGYEEEEEQEEEKEPAKRGRKKKEPKGSAAGDDGLGISL
jgi:hypothetical protein